MKDFGRDKGGLPDTDFSGPRPGDFPLYSPASRAAARAVLERLGSIDRPPNLVIVFMEPSPDGPRQCDSVRATVDGGDMPTVEFERLPEESLSEFQARAEASMRHTRRPRGLTMWSIEKTDSSQS
jgi:hypothetical protein